MILLTANSQICYGGGMLFSLVFMYFLWKRVFGKVKVNCWFCNVDSVVSYTLKNKWTCKHCHQYNGFDKYGDYNKIMPEMFDEQLNNSHVAQQSTREEGNKVHQRAKLCEKCSRNQILKYKQLAQFKPIIEENFALEVDGYKRKLEKLYRLCSVCQETSCRYIKLQDTILRGRMMPHLQKLNRNCHYSCNNTEVLKSDTYSKKSKAMAILFQTLMLVLAVFHALVLVKGYIANGINFTFLPFNLQDINLFSNLTGFLITNGLALSGIIIYSQNIPGCKSGKLYLILWLLSSAMIAIGSSKYYSRLRHIEGLIKLYSNQADPQGILQSLESNGFGEVIFPIVCVTLQSIFCFILMISCFFNIACCLLIRVEINCPEQDVRDQKDDTPAQDISSDTTSIKLAEELYSDDNRSEEDGMEIKDCDSELATPGQGLNGSLNALKLQDNHKDFNVLFSNFKNPNDVFGSSSLPSALHTPPPSRSSSLLSLASHNSASSGGNPSSKVGSSYSTIHFARPSTELPFYRCKANSAIGCWNRSPTVSKSLASSFRPGFQPNLNLRGNLHKPLISPAKLNCFSKRQNTESLNKTLCKEESHGRRKNVLKTFVDAEVSVYDSVSQFGDGIYPELSEDEAHSPIRQKEESNFNSSSPKSTISNITSITMKSVAEVENSRVCRWILAVCLLVNLVLVVLLVLEVKEMREMEHWRSRASL